MQQIDLGFNFAQTLYFVPHINISKLKANAGLFLFTSSVKTCGITLFKASEVLINDAPLRERLAARAKQIGKSYLWKTCAIQTRCDIAEIHQGRSKRAEFSL